MADAVALRACTNKRHRIDFVSGCPVDSYSDPAVRFDSFKRSFVLDHVSRTELEVRGRHLRRDAKRQNAHADQVRAMDAFEASCEYGPPPQAKRHPWPPSRARIPCRSVRRRTITDEAPSLARRWAARHNGSCSPDPAWTVEPGAIPGASRFFTD